MGRASLGGQGASEKATLAKLRTGSGGPTGSLAGTGRVRGPVEFDRRRTAGISVVARGGSGSMDCERVDGPAGSLAGTVGKAKGPAD